MNEGKIKPSIEDAVELSGIETLHPGGLDLSKRIGEIVDMKDKKVLEVACGRGVFACYYAKNYRAKITGIDLNPDLIRASINRAKIEGVEDLVEFKVADALNVPLPFPDNSFDVVANECALGIALDPQKCMDEMTRVVKPGGYIVIHLAVWLKEIAETEKNGIEKRLGGRCIGLLELNDILKKADLLEICHEDWSGIEQMVKARPGREIKRIENIFTLQEKITILFRVLKRFGFKGLSYLGESTKKVTPLYYNGTLGYYLIIGQKK